jgi:hypothetical protein
VPLVLTKRKLAAGSNGSVLEEKRANIGKLAAGGCTHDEYHKNFQDPKYYKD